MRKSSHSFVTKKVDVDIKPTKDIFGVSIKTMFATNICLVQTIIPNNANMAKDFSLTNVNFRETGHIAYADEYITLFVSTNIVPKIYMSVNTPRDAAGLVSGKPKRHDRTQYSKWVTEKTFVRQYRKIREKF